MRKTCISIALSVVVLFTATLAMASPRVWISKSGNNKWTVYGEGMETIGGVDLTINYETSLSNPVVTNGSVVSGTVSMPNTAKPGVIRFAAISPTPFTKSSGDIVTISFGGGAGKVTGISSDLVTAHDNSPKKVSGNAEIREPGDSKAETTSSGSALISSTGTSSTSTPSTPESIGTTASVTSSSGQSTSLGGMTVQLDDPFSRDRKEQEKQKDASTDVPHPDQTPIAAVADKSQSEPESKPVGEKKDKKAQFVANTAVLHLFKQHRGDRTPQEMISLFKPVVSGYSQDPPVFLADGKNTLKVVIPVDTSASASPNFATSKEAQMVSFPKIVEDQWVVELRPKQGVYQATLSYFLDEITTDIPITVAPKLASYNGKPFNTLTENDFVQFLAKTETAKTDTLRDLNGDTIVDYIDDYIFSANFLVQGPQLKTPPPKILPAPTKDDKIDPKLKEPRQKSVDIPVKKTVK